MTRPMADSTAAEQAAYVGVVAHGEGTGTSCGWALPVAMVPGVHSFEPVTFFVPFDLQRNGRAIARINAVTGPLEERVGPALGIRGPGHGLRGPLIDFLSRHGAWVTDPEHQTVEFQVTGAVFAGGDRIAVVGRVTHEVLIGSRAIPVVSADAIGVGARPLRAAREIVLGSERLLALRSRTRSSQL
jgi:hypothetical protein